MSKFSEKDILAFLDGVLDEARCVDFLDLLKHDSTFADRVEGMRVDLEALRDEFDHLLHDPPSITGSQGVRSTLHRTLSRLLRLTKSS